MVDLDDALREGTYVAVGLGVMAFQRAQVRRRELEKRLAPRGDTHGVTTRVASGAAAGAELVADLAAELARGLEDRQGLVALLGDALSATREVAAATGRHLRDAFPTPSAPAPG